MRASEISPEIQLKGRFSQYVIYETHNRKRPFVVNLIKKEAKEWDDSLSRLCDNMLHDFKMDKIPTHAPLMKFDETSRIGVYNGSFIKLTASGYIIPAENESLNYQSDRAREIVFPMDLEAVRFLITKGVDAWSSLDAISYQDSNLSPVGSLQFASGTNDELADIVKSIAKAGLLRGNVIDFKSVLRDKGISDLLPSGLIYIRKGENNLYSAHLLDYSESLSYVYENKCTIALMLILAYMNRKTSTHQFEKVINPRVTDLADFMSERAGGAILSNSEVREAILDKPSKVIGNLAYYECPHERFVFHELGSSDYYQFDLSAFRKLKEKRLLPNEAPAILRVMGYNLIMSAADQLVYDAAITYLLEE